MEFHDVVLKPMTFIFHLVNPIIHHFLELRSLLRGGEEGNELLLVCGWCMVLWKLPNLWNCTQGFSNKNLPKNELAANVPLHNNTKCFLCICKCLVLKGTHFSIFPALQVHQHWALYWFWLDDHHQVKHLMNLLHLRQL